MPKLKNATPKYCKHKASGQAVVTIAGKDHYLGPHGTKASKVEYDRLIGEWLAAGRPTHQTSLRNDITITELCRAYWCFAKGFYTKNGKATDSIYHVKVVLKYLRTAYGHSLAEDFGPLALKAVRSKMVDTGNARTYINDNVAWIRRIFKWAASEELVSVAVFQSLTTVDGLRKGKSKARETAPILPVADDTVEKTLERSIIINCPPIEEDQRRPESELRREFEEDQPSILGGLLDAVAAAIRHLPKTRLDALPRMADFALWVSAAESALPWPAGTFMERYNANRESSHEVAIEASPVGKAVIDFAAAVQSWEGTASELLAELDDRADDKTKRLKSWPKSARKLGGDLRRLAPDLRALGVTVEFDKEPGGKRRRLIRIEAH